MNQKYIIQKDDHQNVLSLKEFAELDKEIMSLVYEQVYDWETITAAAATGTDRLIHVLRSQNIYPPQPYAVKIAETVMAICDTDSVDPAELIFNDIEFVTPDSAAGGDIDDVEEDSADIDDLLEDDLDEGLDDTKTIHKVSSLKVSDDTIGDVDEAAV